MHFLTVRTYKWPHKDKLIDLSHLIIERIEESFFVNRKSAKKAEIAFTFRKETIKGNGTSTS